jgi:hypothetical protein
MARITAIVTARTIMKVGMKCTQQATATGPMEVEVVDMAEGEEEGG